MMITYVLNLTEALMTFLGGSKMKALPAPTQPTMKPVDADVPLVFVYGTLKRGKGNNYLLQDSEFIGRCLLKQHYYMIDLGGFPGVMSVDDIIQPEKSKDLPISNISGELYRTTADVVKSLDALEGHPRFYRRRELPITALAECAYIYLLPTSYLINTDSTPIKGIQKVLVSNGAWKPDSEEVKWLQQVKPSLYQETLL